MEEGGGGGYNNRKTKHGNYQGKNEAIVRVVATPLR